MMQRLIWILMLLSMPAFAELKEFKLVLKDHLFYPARMEVPSGEKIRLLVHNLDGDPEEFDSFDLNREKVLFPGRINVIYVGPLAPGEYFFFGEFAPDTARGTLVAVPFAEQRP
ncbi:MULTISPECIES: cupredoxin domain-containing protein [unclassified Pseudoalteromonas]|uniref:cupredoxin domain-containing protein n=1 Tax=unclassified Pseudoalteromonas TaxID=194690 RepID=UPI001F30890C|nr:MULTISPECIES: cupredoxin domain-containing protein [unclassified Pseudoalteromonas]